MTLPGANPLESIYSAGRPVCVSKFTQSLHFTAQKKEVNLHAVLSAEIVFGVNLLIWSSSLALAMLADFARSHPNQLVCPTVQRIQTCARKAMVCGAISGDQDQDDNVRECQTRDLRNPGQVPQEGGVPQKASSDPNPGFRNLRKMRQTFFLEVKLR